jgi:predicted metal-dependent peptidase
VNKLAAEDVLAAGRLIARRRAPYFGPMINAFVLQPCTDIDTVATSADAVFFYNPEAVIAWTPMEMAGAVVHEVLHLWNRHHGRVGKRDKTMYNLAGDLAINPEILACGLLLPPGALMPRDYGLDPGLSADEYYVLLQKQAEKNKGKDGSQGAQGGSGRGKPTQGGADPAQGGQGSTPPAPTPSKFAGGACGSCAGAKASGEPKPGEGDVPAGRTPAQVERAARQVSEAVAEAGKEPGKVPAAWLFAAKASLDPPVVDWRKELGQALRAAATYRAGAAVHRYDAPSRRGAGLGYGSGAPVLPRMRMPVPVVDVAIDTSGSMGAYEVGEALREVRAVLQAVGSKVSLCVCDAQVHALAPVRTVEEVLPLLKGGGGTDFRPVFDALLGKKPRAEVIVFVTDGYGPAPVAPPPGVNVIWLLTGRYVQTPAPWGRVIRVEDKKRERSGQ